MSNLFAAAASLMDGGNDLTVERDPETLLITRVIWSHDGSECEYLRGMVELITEFLGCAPQDGADKTVIYENILRRIDGRVHDI